MSDTTQIQKPSATHPPTKPKVERGSHQPASPVVAIDSTGPAPEELLSVGPSSVLNPATSNVLSHESSALFQSHAASGGTGNARSAALPKFAGKNFAGVPTHAARQATVQPKLTVGAAHDPYEEEADQVAEQVMRMPALGSAASNGADAPEQSGHAIQRTSEEEELQTKPLAATIRPFVQRSIEEDDEIQTKRGSAADSFETDDDLENRVNATRGSGDPLPDTIRSFMEPRFGAGFSGVRLHSGGEAAELNRSVSAQAFTLGRDIYLGEGQTDVASDSGKRLLAHELTHVVQQGGAIRLQHDLPQHSTETVMRQSRDKAMIVKGVHGYYHKEGPYYRVAIDLSAPIDGIPEGKQISDTFCITIPNSSWPANSTVNLEPGGGVKDVTIEYDGKSNTTTIKILVQPGAKISKTGHGKDNTTIFYDIVYEEKKSPSETMEVAGDVNSKKVIRVAWTIDDGPLPLEGEMQKESLGGVKTTMFIQYSHIGNWEEGARKLAEFQKAGGEIGIHSFHPTEDHAAWLPFQKKEEKFPYSTPYIKLEDAMSALKTFYKKLEGAGIKVKFARMPGGVWSELYRYARYLGYKDTDAKTIATAIRANASPKGVKTGWEQIQKDWKTIKETVSSLGLELRDWDAETSGVPEREDTTTKKVTQADKREKGYLDKQAGQFEKRVDEMKNLKEGTVKSFVILTHARDPKDLAAVKEDKEAMEAYALSNEVRIEYHTLSSLSESGKSKGK